MSYLSPDAEPPLTGKGSKLGPKMRLFVEEYLIDLVASKAVLRAGYKTNNPTKLGTQLLNHPLVKREINKHVDARSERMALSADYVIQKLMNIVEDTESGNPSAALRGLELLGKHLGLYRDRQEISGPDGEAIKMEQKVKQDVSDFKSRLARLAPSGGTGTVVEFPDGQGDTGT